MIAEITEVNRVQSEALRLLGKVKHNRVERQGVIRRAKKAAEDGALDRAKLLMDKAKRMEVMAEAMLLRSTRLLAQANALLEDLKE